MPQAGSKVSRWADPAFWGGAGERAQPGPAVASWKALAAVLPPGLACHTETLETIGLDWQFCSTLSVSELRELLSQGTSLSEAAQLSKAARDWGKGVQPRATGGKIPGSSGPTSLWFFEKLGDNAHGDAKAFTRAMLLIYEFTILIGALFTSICMQVRACSMRVVLPKARIPLCRQTSESEVCMCVEAVFAWLRLSISAPVLPRARARAGLHLCCSACVHGQVGERLTAVNHKHGGVTRVSTHTSFCHACLCLVGPHRGPQWRMHRADLALSLALASRVGNAEHICSRTQRRHAVQYTGKMRVWVVVLCHHAVCVRGVLLNLWHTRPSCGARRAHTLRVGPGKVVPEHDTAAARMGEHAWVVCSVRSGVDATARTGRSGHCTGLHVCCNHCLWLWVIQHRGPLRQLRRHVDLQRLAHHVRVLGVYALPPILVCASQHTQRAMSPVPPQKNR